MVVLPVLGRITRPNCRSLALATAIGWATVADAVAEVVALAWAPAEVAMEAAAMAEIPAKASLREVFIWLAPRGRYAVRLNRTLLFVEH
jgi:hypothetical protein